LGDLDLTAPEPPYYPESGEPEDHILGWTHSDSAAKALGDLWEVAVSPTAQIIRPKLAIKSYKDLQIDENTWCGDDLFRGNGFGGILFTTRARDWFSNAWDAYIEFEEFAS
jgi:hypothetical protein